MEEEEEEEEEEAVLQARLREEHTAASVGLVEMNTVLFHRRPEVRREVANPELRSHVMSQLKLDITTVETTKKKLACVTVLPEPHTTDLLYRKKERACPGRVRHPGTG